MPRCRFQFGCWTEMHIGCMFCSLWCACAHTHTATDVCVSVQSSRRLNALLLHSAIAEHLAHRRAEISLTHTLLQLWISPSLSCCLCNGATLSSSHLNVSFLCRLPTIRRSLRSLSLSLSARPGSDLPPPSEHQRCWRGCLSHLPYLADPFIFFKRGEGAEANCGFQTSCVQFSCGSAPARASAVAAEMLQRWLIFRLTRRWPRLSHLGLYMVARARVKEIPRFDTLIENVSVNSARSEKVSGSESWSDRVPLHVLPNLCVGFLQAFQSAPKFKNIDVKAIWRL